MRVTQWIQGWREVEPSEQKQGRGAEKHLE